MVLKVNKVTAEEVISNQLPYIGVVTKRLSADGHELEFKEVSVRGKNLSECKKVFDEVQKNEKKV